MKFTGTIQLLVLMISSLSALLLGIWAGMPWWCIGGAGILFIGLIAMEIFPRKGSGAWAAGMASIGTVLGVGYLLFGAHYWDGFHAVWGSLVTLPALMASVRMRSRPAIWQWRLPAMAWALATDAVWLGAAYEKNDRLGFYAALLLSIVLLMLAKGWFRLTAPVVLCINTGILLLIGLPAANLLVSPADSLGIPPALSERPFSYAYFKKDPAGYARWLNYLQGQYISCFIQRLYEPVSGGPVGHKLRPNSEAMFCEGHISINSKGFRGAEIADDKKDAYRIVVLGESTTFGYTIYAGEKPWCELLQQMIEDRLKPSRPVEVINAGIPSYNINQNLYRLPSQILPLKPDMIISYHGFNGFFLLGGSLPPISTTKPPPLYERRPLKLLADLEYQIKLNNFKKHLKARMTARDTPLTNPMESEYADAYRQLIRICQTNDIHLVLSTYSMAVNEQSDVDVIQFYHRTTLSLPTVLQANVIHSIVVSNLAKANQDIGFVDTHPGLDGVDGKFIDVMHFAPEGEQQMAETFFAGIKDYLVKGLAGAANGTQKR